MGSICRLVELLIVTWRTVCLTSSVSLESPTRDRNRKVVEVVVIHPVGSSGLHKLPV